MRNTLLIVLLQASILFAKDSYESNIESAVESLRTITPTEDKSLLEKYNNLMDNNWSVFRTDTNKSIPILSKLLEKEMAAKEPNDLVLMDIAWFIALSDGRPEINAILLKAYQMLDYQKKIISYNGEQYFRLSLFLSGRQLPGFLDSIDKRFLRKSGTSFFIPKHLAMVDAHSQRTHLYGVYGSPSISHLLKILNEEKDVSLRRSLTSILRRICTSECAQPIFEYLKSEKDHEAFVNGTYIMLDNVGPAGRDLYLKLTNNKLSAKTADYFRSEQQYVKKVTFEYLVDRIRRKFGEQPSSISDSELLIQADKMAKNFGSSETLHPMHFLNSKIDKTILIEKLVESRRRCFFRINRHGLDDIDISNMIINALYYKK